MDNNQELGNTVRLRGFVNHLKDTPIGKTFSMTLEAGKDQHGGYRKEYMRVNLGSQNVQNCRFVQGSKVWVSGRMRAEKYEYNGENKISTFVQAFDVQEIEPPRDQQFQAPQQQQYQPVQQQQQQYQAPQQQQYQAPQQQPVNRFQQPQPQQQQQYQPVQQQPYAPNPGNPDDIPF